MPSTDGKTIPPIYPPAGDAERAALIAWAREVPLLYGRWKHFKSLYKRVEAAGDEPDLLAALIARIDTARPVRPAQASRSVLTPDLRFVGGIVCDPTRPLALALAGSWYQADRLQILDVSEPLRPVPLGAARLDDPRSVCFCGSLACVLSGGSRRGGRLLLFDLSDPARPRQTGALGVGALDGDEGFVAAFPSGRHVAVIVKNSLLVVDISDPSQPRQAGSIGSAGARAVAVTDRFAFVTMGGSGFRWSGLPRAGGLQIVDVSDPAHPRALGSTDVGNPRGVAVTGRWAYVTTERGTRAPVGLHVLDVSDPAHPRKIGHVDGPDGGDIVLHGNHALVSGGYDGLFVVDVADPVHPRFVTRLSVGGEVTGVARAGDYALLAAGWGGLEVVDVSDPDRPVRAGDGPGAETIGYMKRRARRFLRHFARRSPERYVEIAAGLLAESGHGRESLDLAHQWVSVDILFGASDRYAQRRHGRGGFVPGNERRLRLRTREENAPAAWNRRPDLAQRLYRDPDLPWQTHETALKILRAGGVSVPDPDPETLLRFLRGPSPLLHAVATRALVLKIEAGEAVSPDAAALGYFLSPAHRRRRMRARLPGYAAARSWSRSFAQVLFERATAGMTGDGRMSRRQIGAAALLARELAAEIPAESVLPVLAPLLRAGQPDLLRLALGALEQVPAAFAGQWLAALAGVTGEAREEALAALARAVSGQSFNLDVARALVTAEAEEVRAAAWRLLAASRTDEATITALWQELLAVPRETPALRTAFGTPAALALLGRARLDSAWLSGRLAESPWLVRLFGPETFVRITENAPAAVTVSLIAAAPEDQWPALRGPWLTTLRGAPDGLAAFWKAAFAALRAESDAGVGPLAARFLEDAAVAETFLSVEDASLLETSDDPQLGPLLLRWARAHADRFVRDSPLLLAAATHGVPEVREWGLARVREVGMSLPFALRLFESGLPPAEAASRAFFEDAGRGEARELEYALVLCDSPRENARALGRAFVEARWDTLPHDTMLARLFENPEPEIQAFVADLLGKIGQRPEATPVFDRAVLRSRSRARRARERVKERQAEEPTVDVATLLELARSRTPRDREWALAELAKRSLAGEPVEGLSVEGVAGI